MELGRLSVVAAAQLGQGQWAGVPAAALAQDGHVTEVGAQVLLAAFGFGVPVGEDVQ